MISEFAMQLTLERIAITRLCFYRFVLMTVTVDTRYFCSSLSGRAGTSTFSVSLVVELDAHSCRYGCVPWPPVRTDWADESGSFHSFLVATRISIPNLGSG